jgi:hypothetical protein
VAERMIETTNSGGIVKTGIEIERNQVVRPLDLT